MMPFAAGAGAAGAGVAGVGCWASAAPRASATERQSAPNEGREMRIDEFARNGVRIPYPGNSAPFTPIRKWRTAARDRNYNRDYNCNGNCSITENSLEEEECTEDCQRVWGIAVRGSNSLGARGERWSRLTPARVHPGERPPTPARRSVQPRPQTSRPPRRALTPPPPPGCSPCPPFPQRQFSVIQQSPLQL